MQGINPFLENLKENTPLEIHLPDDGTMTNEYIRGSYAAAAQDPISVTIEVDDERILMGDEWLKTGHPFSVKILKSEFFDRVKVLKNLDE